MQRDPASWLQTLGQLGYPAPGPSGGPAHPARPARRSRRLLPLLRFHSSKSPDKLVSLADYVERMKDGQKHIYYLVGKCRCLAALLPLGRALTVPEAVPVQPLRLSTQTRRWCTRARHALKICNGTGRGWPGLL